MKQVSPKMQRQRKFLIVLPLLIIPFLTMAFWALGGGKNAAVVQDNAETGLNPELPGASLKDDKAMDKMGYYDQAAADSMKLQEQMKNDPYFTKTDTAADPVLDALHLNEPVHFSGNGSSNHYADPNEAKVYEKLGQLNAALKENAGSPGKKDYDPPVDYTPQTEAVSKLEHLMAAGNVTTAAPDPEMKQLNGMLEKILDIQHPERVKAAMKKEADSVAAKIVSNERSAVSFSSFDMGTTYSGGFFGLHDQTGSDSANAITAVVHENQTLVSGAVVKMRLLSDIVVDGHRIPKDHFIFGTASLNHERLEISISFIRDGASVYPVQMDVFDMDGLPGIYIPGAIGRDVAKQSGDQALQSVTLGTVDPSFGAQAATAGIETAKNLLSRKVKLIKVQVKAGYKILLKNKTR